MHLSSVNSHLQGLSHTAAAGYVLAADLEAVREAGAALWPRLASAYLDARLAGVKPADGGAGERFQRLAAAATAFEDAAAKAGWVPGVGPGARTARRGRIHSYVKHALNRYLHAKRLRSVPEVSSESHRYVSTYVLSQLRYYCSALSTVITARRGWHAGWWARRGS